MTSKVHGQASAATQEPAEEATGAPSGGEASLARPDQSIAEEITERLSDELDADDVTAAVENGVVTLDGIVDRSETLEAAERIAAGVPGVRAIESRLRLRGGADQE